MIFPQVSVLSSTSCDRPHCMALGDVDNDGDAECILGDLQGNLMVCKGLQGPMISTTIDGSIIGVAAVNIAVEDDDDSKSKSSRNFIMALTQEGMLRIIAVTGGELKEIARAVSVPTNAFRFHIHRQPDGKLLAVFISTDRFVHVQNLDVKMPTADLGDIEIKLLPLFRYQNDEQLGSIAFLGDQDETSEFLISQSHGNFLKFRLPHLQPSEYQVEQIKSNSPSPTSSRAAAAEMITIAPISRNHNVTSKTTNCRRWIAYCSLDGFFRLWNVDDANDETNIFQSNHQVQLQFFSIHNFTIKDYGDFIVAFSWSGMACILDCQTMHVHKFPFNRRVSACIAGSFATSSNKSEPCILVADFSQNLYIFHGFDAHRHFERFNKTIFDRTVDELRMYKDALGVDIDNKSGMHLLLYL